MVRVFVVLAALVLSLYADSALLEKVRSFVGDERFASHHSFIGILFKNESAFYVGDRIDAVKVVETLKQNGLLKLYFNQPHDLSLTFTTNGQALYFVKLMGDTLHAIGYYRYMTEYSKRDESQFVWRITMRSEYATDPTVLRQELQKRGCDISDIERLSQFEWHYNINMVAAHLDAIKLDTKERVSLKRSLQPHWVNVSQIKKVKISSHGANVWHPYIAFFDTSLHLLKVYKRDRKTWQVQINIPQNSLYMKIDDLYHLKNIKDGLDIEAMHMK